MPRIHNTGCIGGNIDKVVLIRLDNLQLEYHMTSTNQGTLGMKVTQPFKVRITLCEVGLTGYVLHVNSLCIQVVFSRQPCQDYFGGSLYIVNTA